MLYSQRQSLNKKQRITNKIEKSQLEPPKNYTRQLRNGDEIRNQIQKWRTNKIEDSITSVIDMARFKVNILQLKV